MLKEVSGDTSRKPYVPLVKKVFETTAIVGLIYAAKAVLPLLFMARVLPDEKNRKKWKVEAETKEESYVMRNVRIYKLIFGVAGRDPFRGFKTKREAGNIAGAVEDIVRRDYSD